MFRVYSGNVIEVFLCSVGIIISVMKRHGSLDAEEEDEDEEEEEEEEEVEVATPSTPLKTF